MRLRIRHSVEYRRVGKGKSETDIFHESTNIAMILKKWAVKHRRLSVWNCFYWRPKINVSIQKQSGGRKLAKRTARYTTLINGHTDWLYLACLTQASIRMRITVWYTFAWNDQHCTRLFKMLLTRKLDGILCFCSDTFFANLMLLLCINNLRSEN